MFNLIKFLKFNKKNDSKVFEGQNKRRKNSFLIKNIEG